MIDLNELLKNEFGDKKPYELSNKLAIVEALLTAKHHHCGQLRKYTGEPYITHCQDVVTILQYADGVTYEAIQAAWLHDTVEDTDYTLDRLQQEFGDTVAKYVWYLTNVPKFVGNRAKRAAIDNDRLIRAPRLVKEIKCADIISNCLNIAELDPYFAETYFREKEVLLFGFTKHQLDVNYEYGYHVENLTLLPLARKVVEDGLNLLKIGGKK
jgi:(p)ppGpp synthase/HD superfamily hydrolase